MKTLLGDINKKFLEKKYNELYDRADKLFKDINPCKFESGMCSVNCSCRTGCCIKGCPHHSNEKGCGIVCLPCKLYICGQLQQSSAKDFISSIKQLFYEYLIWGMRIPVRTPKGLYYDSFSIPKKEHITSIIDQAEFTNCAVNINGNIIGNILHPSEIECSRDIIIYMMKKASGLDLDRNSFSSKGGYISAKMVAGAIYRCEDKNGNSVGLNVPKYPKTLSYKDL